MSVERNPHFEAARAALEAWSREPGLEPPVSHTFECHIFCDPLDPTDAQRDAFARACEAEGLKGLCLGLDFEGKGVINVLQSTKYYTCDDVRTPVARMLDDARRLDAHFRVIRLKLEAVAADPGVPVTDEEAGAMPGDTYFEYHLKVNAPPTPESDARLKALAAELTADFGIKIPFSCNNMANKTQRFLNARTYGLGREASYALIERLKEAIEARGVEVGKVIREFIVFDTNKALDRGWVEPA